MRPLRTDRNVISNVAQEMLPGVLAWLREDATEADHIKGQLVAALEDGDFDAYKAAKYLDDTCCWEVDSRLLDILDSAFGKAVRHHDLLVAAWVTDQKINPAFEIGSKVKFKRGSATNVGEVTHIDRRLATYTVYCVTLGHVREGLGTHGCIVAFEDAEPE